MVYRFSVSNFLKKMVQIRYKFYLYPYLNILLRMKWMYKGALTFIAGKSA